MYLYVGSKSRNQTWVELNTQFKIKCPKIGNMQQYPSLLAKFEEIVDL